MPVRTYTSETSANTAVVTTAETVVATLSGLSTYKPGEPILLRGECQFTTGANTTGLTFRIRRDSLTGTVVNEANIEQVEAAAGSTESHDIQCDDQFSGEVANQAYVLTVEATAASANGSALYAYLSAEVG